MSAETIHALKLRIWKQTPKKRAVYLSDLEAAQQLPAGAAQDAALADISSRVAYDETLVERSKKRKEAALKAAEDKIRQDLGF
jgi:hypothetical protein